MSENLFVDTVNAILSQMTCITQYTCTRTHVQNTQNLSQILKLIFRVMSLTYNIKATHIGKRLISFCSNRNSL